MDGQTTVFLAGQEVQVVHLKACLTETEFIDPSLPELSMKILSGASTPPVEYGFEWWSHGDTAIMSYHCSPEIVEAAVQKCRVMKPPQGRTTWFVVSGTRMRQKLCSHLP